jgi:hypothetical protein
MTAPQKTKCRRLVDVARTGTVIQAARKASHFGTGEVGRLASQERGNQFPKVLVLRHTPITRDETCLSYGATADTDS